MLPAIASGFWNKSIAVQIWGANTGVGKTILSTILCKHVQNFRTNDGKPGWSVQYLKPVSTGHLQDADYRYVEYVYYPVRLDAM